MARWVKRRKVEGTYIPLKKKRYYSMGYGKRKYYKSVPRSRGGLFASPEIKYFDFQQFAQLPICSTTAMPNSVTTSPIGSGCCFAPTLGNDITNRIGRRCAIKKIKVRGAIICGSQTAQNISDFVSKCRVVLYVDKQANASRAALDVLFQSNAASTSQFTIISTFQNLASLGRFRILKDKFFQMQNSNMTGNPSSNDVIQQGIMQNFKITVNFKKPLVVNFNATNGGTFADIVDNCVQILGVCADTQLQPFISYYGRCSFVDI